jgi:hypothetical protein
MMFRGSCFSAVLGALALLFTTLSAPPARADAGQYVRTQSGIVQCVLYADYPGTDPRYNSEMNIPAGSVVMCEARRAGGFGPGKQFAVVGAAGNFSFQCCASGLGGATPIDFLTMAYGQTYNLMGWSVSANSDGTRFTNNATGHGMFVSIENIYGF